jgi:flagellar FliJ protein
MERERRFDLLMQLAEERDRDAARALGSRRRVLEDARAKLEDLSRYRRDHGNALADTGGEGLGIQVQEYLRFLSRLNKAILEQQRSVEQHSRALDVAVEHWQATQKEVAVLAKVRERGRIAERKETERREQKLIDEMAGARHLAPREESP